MKLPEVPQFTEDEINTAIGLARDPAVLKAAVEYNTRYLFWEELRHHPLPADARSVWALMKLLRRAQAREIVFAGLHFPYTLAMQARRCSTISTRPQPAASPACWTPSGTTASAIS